MPALRGPCSIVSLLGMGRWRVAGFTLLTGTVSVPGDMLLVSGSIK